MGTREEVSLRSLKDSKDSEVQAGAELGELGRRGRYQRRARPTCLDGKDGEGASYGAPRRGLCRWGPAERLPLRPTHVGRGDCAGVGLGNALVGEPRDMEASKGAVPTGGVREGCPSIQSSGPY